VGRATGASRAFRWWAKGGAVLRPCAGVCRLACEVRAVGLHAGGGAALLEGGAVGPAEGPRALHFRRRGGAGATPGVPPASRQKLSMAWGLASPSPLLVALSLALSLPSRCPLSLSLPFRYPLVALSLSAAERVGSSAMRSTKCSLPACRVAGTGRPATRDCVLHPSTAGAVWGASRQALLAGRGKGGSILPPPGRSLPWAALRARSCGGHCCAHSREGPRGAPLGAECEPWGRGRGGVGQRGGAVWGRCGGERHCAGPAPPYPQRPPPRVSEAHLSTPVDTFAASVVLGRRGDSRQRGAAPFLA